MPNARTHTAFAEAHAKLCELIDRFSSYAKTKYQQSSYQEAEARKDFIDPLVGAGSNLSHRADSILSRG